ncbi:MAG TPA: TonB-dependent receptor [Hanamia sp.]|nr:TonB-dependent receptor [Hanamia sp.]
MKFFLVLLLLSSQVAFAQQKLVVRVLNDDTNQPISGATVTTTIANLGTTCDNQGIGIIAGLPIGKQLIRISTIGYETKSTFANIMQNRTDTLTVDLEPSEQALQDVVVSTTRNNSYIKDLPVRVEVIGADDINEKIGSTPANVSELLGEAPGLQVLPTSTSTGNMSVRIQGLEGRYTQLLQDGFPMYGGFSGGLSLLQIPPLNLKRVEIIKGASSALYGGDAIAGLINFITKTPGVKPHFDFLMNQSQRGATDISSFYSGRKNKLGVTLLATYDRQTANDINHDGFADLPQSETVTFNPKIFYYFNDSTILSLSVNATVDNRAGGDMFAIQNQPDAAHPYLEQNKSQRNYYQLSFTKQFHYGNSLTLKNSVSYYNRAITLPGYAFGGKDWNSYSEASYLLNWGKHKTVVGLNFTSDDFMQNINLGSAPGRYSFSTFGTFLQDDWALTDKLHSEIGFRGDAQNKYGVFPLPRIALLYKFSPAVYARIGAGMGYQVPTVFNILPDQSDFSNVLPISNAVKATTSKGLNLDVNYTTNLSDEITFTYDQNFFITSINNPVIPQPDSLGEGIYDLVNAGGAELARGLESNFTFNMDNWEFDADYTYTNATNRFDKIRPQVPLDPKNKVLLTLVYEKENHFKAGIEGYYSGKQYLSDGSQARDYWTVDLVAEKMFKHFSIVANIENVTDTRQSRFGPLVMPPYNHPSFSEIYAPLAGRIANLEIRFQL